MSKRPPVDLAAITSLTSAEATPMAEATQRLPSAETPKRSATVKAETRAAIPVDYSDSLNFKVPPAFKERYRIAAAKSGLKLNELLFEALDAWEALKR